MWDKVTKKVIFFALFMGLFPLVSGQLSILGDEKDTVVNIEIPKPQTNYSLIPTVNSSDFWDNLDTPNDINAGDITDDGTYIKNNTDGGYNAIVNKINITQGDYSIYSAIFDLTGLGVTDIIELVGEIGSVYFRDGIVIRGVDNFAKITYADSLDDVENMGTATTTYYPSALGDYPADSLVFTDADGGYYFDGNVTNVGFINGYNLTDINNSISTARNPFDQSLNTTDNVTFDYVNVTSNLNVKGNISANYGFFDYLGSLVNKIGNLFVSNATIEVLNVTSKTTFNDEINHRGIWNETWYNNSGSVVLVKGWNGTMFYEYYYG